MVAKRNYLILGALCIAVGVYLVDHALVKDQPGCKLQPLAAAVPPDTTLTAVEARWFPIQHCRVEGYVTTANPGPNRVNFVLQLPEETSWNGRYVFIGLGGGAGRITTLSESPFGSPVGSGFAVAGTDTGHRSFLLNPLDWSFLSNDAMTLDHIHRGAHVSAVATQALTRAYYGTTSIHRYHVGCSGGGRMGVMAAIHHPGDYDGYLIGAPGITIANVLNFIWISQQMQKLPGHSFDTDKLQRLEQDYIAHCDSSDGVLDQMVWDSRKCPYDPGRLKCAPGQVENSCFTIPELEAITSILAGPRNASGQVYPGLTPTNPSGWSFFLNWMAGVIAASFSEVYFGPDFDYLTDFDFNDQADVDAWWAAVRENGFGLRASGDYREVAAAGGKVIFWHGVSDPAISVLDQIAYYEEIRGASGSDERLQQFSRMYLVPGLLHCFGGPGPIDVPDRLLEQLLAWVEQGSPPGAVVTQRGQEARAFESHGIFKYLPAPDELIDTPPAGTPPREFLLCPYPEVSTYTGTDKSSAAVYDAANWACEALR